MTEEQQQLSLINYGCIRRLALVSIVNRLCINIHST